MCTDLFRPSVVDCSAADLGFLTLPKGRLTGCGSDRNGTHAQQFLETRQPKFAERKSLVYRVLLYLGESRAWGLEGQHKASDVPSFCNLYETGPVEWDETRCRARIEGK